jgi:hypothetical protein
MKIVLAILAVTAALALSSASLASDGAKVTVKKDKNFGNCPLSELLPDFIGRYPPSSDRFELEINFIEATGEVELYYPHPFITAPKGQKPINMPDRPIAYYDGETCEFLREEFTQPVQE